MRLPAREFLSIDPASGRLRANEASPYTYYIPADVQAMIDELPPEQAPAAYAGEVIVEIDGHVVILSGLAPRAPASPTEPAEPPRPEGASAPEREAGREPPAVE